VVDACTRECLALKAENSNGRLTRVLDRLIAERGRPEAVRSDNGPGFTPRRVRGCAEEHKIELVERHIARSTTAPHRSSANYSK
jgi:putative transposase